MTSTVEVLQKARALIEKPESWGKGRRHFDRPRCTFCAAEAIEEAAPLEFGSTESEFGIRRSAFMAMNMAAGIDGKWGDLPNWNDTPHRTHAEVLAAFDKAIELAKLSADTETASKTESAS